MILRDIFSEFQKRRPEPDPEIVDFVGHYIDKIWMHDWPEESGQDAYVEIFQALPAPQRVIWATWCLQSEVENGGHSQYFCNLIHDCYLNECLRGLEVLGATKIAQITNAVSLIKPGKSELNTANS